jgi:hypothetical protein
MIHYSFLGNDHLKIVYCEHASCAGQSMTFFSKRTMCVNPWDEIFREVHYLPLPLQNLVWSLNPLKSCLVFKTCLCLFYQSLPSEAELVLQLLDASWSKCRLFDDFIRRSCSWITWRVLIRTMILVYSSQNYTCLQNLLDPRVDFSHSKSTLKCIQHVLQIQISTFQSRFLIDYPTQLICTGTLVDVDNCDKFKVFITFSILDTVVKPIRIVHVNHVPVHIRIRCVPECSS